MRHREKANTTKFDTMKIFFISSFYFCPRLDSERPPSKVGFTYQNSSKAQATTAMMMFHSSSSSSTSIIIPALLVASASISFVVAQTETEIAPIIDKLNGKISSTAAPPGYNVEGTSVFTNLARAYRDGQFFILRTGSWVYEKPESETVHYTKFSWCSDLTFSDLNNSSLIGYAGRCIAMILSGYADGAASGAQLPPLTFTQDISAVFVEHLNIFEGQYHGNTDDYVYRYWDDGRKTMPTLGWEGHDEGDMISSAATSSWSTFGEITWMSTEEVAQLLNTSVDEYTPENFKQVYKDTWIKSHELEAAEKNPNPGPELEIIEQVKNETTSPADENVTPVQTDIGDDPSGSGRKLTSVATRFVSSALRIFGI